MIVQEEYRIADKVIEDNAHLWIESCIDELQYDMTFKEKRAWITHRNRGFMIYPGERYRWYMWTDDEYIPEPWEVRGEEYEISEICEIPVLAEMCKKYKLYP